VCIVYVYLTHTTQRTVFDFHCWQLIDRCMRCYRDPFSACLNWHLQASLNNIHHCLLAILLDKFIMLLSLADDAQSSSSMTWMSLWRFKLCRAIHCIQCTRISMCRYTAHVVTLCRNMAFHWSLFRDGLLRIECLPTFSHTLEMAFWNVQC